jgi:hypothetical protein
MERGNKTLGPVLLATLFLLSGFALRINAQQREQAEALPKAPEDIKPGSISYEEISYPYPVHGEFLKSRGDRRLIQSATVLLPPVRSKV